LKSRNIGVGIFLLVIGLVWLLTSFHVINWSILESLYRLWPLFFVVIGINMIFREKPAVKLVTWLLFVAALVGYGYYVDQRYDNQPQTQLQAFAFEKNTEAREGEMRLDVGGVRMELGSAENNLVEGEMTGSFDRRSVQQNNDKAFVDFRQGSFNFFRGNSVNQQCRVRLNKDVAWDLQVKAGIVNGTLDMSDLKVKALDLALGAGDLDIIFGSTADYADVKIDAGASKVAITVPEDAGVRIRMDGGLSSNNLGGGNWDKNGEVYTSKNYNDAVRKIDMHIDMGVGKLDVNIK
jgi:hypothetical protein